MGCPVEVDDTLRAVRLLGITIVTVALVGCSGFFPVVDVGDRTLESVGPPKADTILAAAAPAGYRLERLDPKEEQQRRASFGGHAGADMAELHMHQVTKGSFPVATVYLLRLPENFERAGIHRDVQESMGATAEPVDLGEHDGTLLISEGLVAIVTTTLDYALFVTGQDRSEVETVARSASAAM